jgi:iron complex transport system substrate-binding protein
MRNRRAAAALAALVALVLAAGVARISTVQATENSEPRGQAGAAPVPVQAPPQRIISLVPAVTEMLFAIGAGPRVVGVSSFDKYPPEAATRTRVGALVDPDLERILSLRPDLVIVYATQDELRAQLGRAAIPAFVYQHRGLPDITKAMRDLAVAVGSAAQGEEAARGFENAVDRVRQAVAARPRPRTLLVFGREPSALRNIYVSGGVGFLHDALVAAGGRNVFEEVHRESVQASTEMILARAPEVIVELRASALSNPERGEQDRSAWQRLPGVPAVRTGRIQVLRGDHLVSPGPRFASAIEELARALHPEAFGSAPR